MILIFSLFLDIPDAKSIVNLSEKIDSRISFTSINYYNIPELTGFRIKGDNIFLYDLSFFGIYNYNEVKIGFGKSFYLPYIQIDFLPYFLFFRAGDIKNFGFTEKIDITLRYLDFECGFITKDIFFLFKDEIPSYEEFFLSYKKNNLFHNLKISYSILENLNIHYGIEINSNPLFVRLGVSTSPVLPSFGIGFNKGKMMFEFGFLSHPILGFTENFTISILK
uniref:Uncharacterized protein n=1 Tax=candidate division WOR-3 bacterium TaxID=2052148 RepID=A0A7C4YAA7_UNCW3